MSRDITVDEWLSSVPDDRRASVNHLRALIASAHGELTEHIKWNAPSFCIDGDDRVTINLGPKGDYRIVFHRSRKAKANRGFSFEDPDHLAKWPSPDRAVVTLANAGDIETKRESLSRFIHRWVEATR